jgi:murein L,D-transpeptidase YafK
MFLGKNFLLIGFFLLASGFSHDFASFEATQKTYPRVSAAYERKEEMFLMKCKAKQVSEQFSDMFIRVFKQEKTMEIWAKNEQGAYVKFAEYAVASMSGTLGPKRQQGDLQVPEGFYTIVDYNPLSNYHLSLGINYPNNSDNILSAATRKGGDIYIHGREVSSGCMAMTDYYIEEIYMAAVKARTQGQAAIPVHIFPFKMTVINMAYYERYSQFKAQQKFWKNLQLGYQFFERNNRLPQVNVGGDGYYRFADPLTTRAAN